MYYPKLLFAIAFNGYIISKIDGLFSVAVSVGCETQAWKRLNGMQHELTYITETPTPRSVAKSVPGADGYSISVSILA